MNIDIVNRFAKQLELLQNRIKIINQMLGCRLVGSSDSHMRITLRRGVYRIDLCGEEYATIKAYDVEGASKVLDMIEGLNEGLWLTLRSNVINVT